MPSILFLTLKVFSATGGIEKVCRVAGKALYEMGLTGPVQTRIMSMHDKTEDAHDNIYFPAEIFEGYGAHKINFVRAAVQKGRHANTVILSHINLLLVGWMIKKLSPKTRIILMAHGIEIWGPLSKSKTKMLGKVDQVWAVSHYTQSKIISQHGFAASKVAVLNNCLDPFLTASKNVEIPADLYSRYGITTANKILFTLTRLSSKEKYKGYEDVITALKELNDPSIKYIIAGKADETELQHVKEKIIKAGLKEHVILAGFIPDKEVAAHYKMSDCYIMPSSGEGFGVSFIEAMFYGLPVIAGNGDGSTDALDNGALGLLVDPDDNNALQNAITQILQQPYTYKPNEERLQELFSYNSYKNKLYALLREVKAA